MFSQEREELRQVFFDAWLFPKYKGHRYRDFFLNLE